MPANIDLKIRLYIVCRGLFRDRGILHRDRSAGNVLWDESDSVPAEDTAPVPTVFIGHLLDARHVALPL